MEINQLEAFLCVVKTRSFTRPAEGGPIHNHHTCYLR